MHWAEMDLLGDSLGLFPRVSLRVARPPLRENNFLILKNDATRPPREVFDDALCASTTLACAHVAARGSLHVRARIPEITGFSSQMSALGARCAPKPGSGGALRIKYFLVRKNLLTRLSGALEYQATHDAVRLGMS